MAKHNFVPKLPQKLSRQILPTKDIPVNSINISLGALNNLMTAVPARYGWRFKIAEAFTAEFKELGDSGAQIHEPNAFYWKDVLRTCEAYSLMCTWRMGELASSCVWALARDDINCAALTARAALEAAAQYVDTSRTVSASLEQLTEENLQTHICVSEDIERLLLKIVFGTRLESEEEIYKTTNIVTILGGSIRSSRYRPTRA